MREKLKRIQISIDCLCKKYINWCEGSQFDAKFMQEKGKFRIDRVLSKEKKIKVLLIDLNFYGLISFTRSKCLDFLFKFYELFNLIVLKPGKLTCYECVKNTHNQTTHGDSFE